MYGDVLQAIQEKFCSLCYWSGKEKYDVHLSIFALNFFSKSLNIHVEIPRSLLFLWNIVGIPSTTGIFIC